MSDDIKIKITGDLSSLKKYTKSASKIIDRFDKKTKEVSNNRVVRTRKNEGAIKEIRQKSIQRLMALDAKRSKANKRSDEQRIKAEKKNLQKREKEIQRTENAIKDVRLKNIQRLMALDAKQTKARKREAEKRRKAELREEKKLAREKAVIARKTAARRQRISRGVRRGAGAVGALFGLAGGATVLFKAQEILKFDEALARTSVQAGITVEDQLKLRNSINETSVSYGVQRDVILKTVNEIVDKSGDIGLAADNLEVISKIIRGTNAEAQDVGQLFASIRNAFKGSGSELSNSEVAQFIEILISQGDQAQITLANLAGEGEKLFGAFKGAGLRSKQDFINFGALIQTAGETGTPSEAATSAVRFLSEVTKQQKKLKKFGVNVFKPGTKGDLKKLNVIIKDILEKTGGDVTKLQSIFSERAIKPLKILAAEFRNTGGEINSFNKLVDLGANAQDNIQKKYARVSKTASQGFEKMKAAFTVVLDGALAPVLDDIAEAMVKMTNNPDALKTLQTTFRAMAQVLRLAAKVPGFFAGAGEFFARGKAGKIREQSNIINSRARMEIERNRLKYLEDRTPQEQKELENINLQLQNNIIVDERGKIIQSEALLKRQENAKRMSYRYR